MTVIKSCDIFYMFRPHKLQENPVIKQHRWSQKADNMKNTQNWLLQKIEVEDNELMKTT